MKILVSWLREFVTVPVSLDELVAALNMRGFEVAAVEPPPPGVGRSGEDEAVLDLEITTNRPDCLSVAGIAREVATIYDTPLHPPGLPGTDGSDARLVPRASPSPTGPAGNDTLSVTLEETALCPRYRGGPGGRERVRVSGLDDGTPAGSRDPADQQRR